MGWFYTDDRAILNEIRKLGGRIMGLLEDLRAAQTDTNAKLDLIAGEVAALDTEVKDLISKIGPGLTADDVAQAQAISTRLGTLSDALKAIPPEPTA